jgi:hypothetical protein
MIGKIEQAVGLFTSYFSYLNSNVKEINTFCSIGYCHYSRLSFEEINQYLMVGFQYISWH